MREEIISAGEVDRAWREDVSGSDRMYFCKRAGGSLWLSSPFCLCYKKKKKIPKTSSVGSLKLHFSLTVSRYKYGVKIRASS